MPISRDARMDRRRRFLRENVDDEVQNSSGTRRQPRKNQEADVQELAGPKRKAGYSQDVRKACGQRLVQLIPVRRRSFAAVVFVSLLIPSLLLAAHYFIHVKGVNQWWRHPLSVAMDVGHSRSIAAWLSSQLWLLCLAATVLTFQLRRHKLDDYNGEYRLWFWLVLTCLVASVDATTDITQLFATALDRWTQMNLGWSGSAVVDSTLAVLIGMLGLRMCTELKTVPMSLVLWLTGLVAWAGSAALARPEFRLEMSEPIRYWLISVFWLGGLTLIWLSALTYLRNIYVEAQRRFLLRGRLASLDVPLGQRLRESLPKMPKFRRSAPDGQIVAEGETASVRWGLPAMPKFLKRSRQVGSENDSPPVAPRAKRRVRAEAEAEIVSTVTRPSQVEGETTASHANRPQKPAVTTPTPKGLGGFLRRGGAKPEAEASVGNAPQPLSTPKASRIGSWLRRPKDTDEPDEYRKVTPTQRDESSTAAPIRPTARKRPDADENEIGTSDSKPKRRWLPRISRPKLSVPKLPSIPKPKLGGLMSRIKLPKLGLPSLRLPPPEEIISDSPPSSQSRDFRTVNSARPLPSTSSSNANTDSEVEFDEDNSDDRPMSRAERKRLRRNAQQQNRRSA